MADTGLTCRTFCNRLLHCYYLKEKNDYVKTSRLLFERVLKEYRDTDKSLLTSFVKEFTNRAFTGIRAVYSEHTIDYKTFCVNCITNLDLFFETYEPTDIMHRYTYRYKIKGYIGCRIPGYNVHFFYKNLKETEKDLDFACINSYIYNQVHNLSNACMVMCVPANVFYLMDYDEKDYTMGRGFLTQTKRNKLKRRGDHCVRCKHNCKPLYINGLDRLGAHI